MAVPKGSEEPQWRRAYPDAWRRHCGAIVVLVCVAGFYVTMIRQGDTWGDDFALYILHAENIATGRPYADTGYIYNPADPIYGPPTYPPIFPLLLVPVYHFAGLNLWAMKCEQVVFFVLALLMIYLCLLQYASAPNASLVIAVLGFNPNFWAAKDNILSDLPFLFLFWMAAWLASRQSRHWSRAVLLGSVLYLAAGTRTIGITILAGFLLYELLTRRKLTAFALIAITMCLGLLAIQSRCIPSSQGSYFDSFHPTLASVVGNAVSYTRALATFWMGNSKSVLAFIILGITSALAILGFYAHAKRGLALLEITLALYLCAVVIWPARQGLRLIYPVIPFYVYLIVAGFSLLTSHFSKSYLRAVATAALLLLVSAGYAGGYRSGNLHVIAETDGLASFNDLCRRVQAITHDDDVFLCRRPRALTLFARRPAAVYEAAKGADWWRFAEKIHASYLLCNRREAQDAEFLMPFIDESKPNLELVYQNGDFDLYRIRSYDLALVNRNP